MVGLVIKLGFMYFCAVPGSRVRTPIIKMVWMDGLTIFF